MGTPSFQLLASAKGQGEAQPQHEVAGTLLQRSEAGRTEFAARARHPCQAPRSQQLEGEAKQICAYIDISPRFLTGYKHKNWRV